MRLLAVIVFASVALVGFKFVTASEVGVSVEENINDNSLDLEENGEDWDLDLSDIFNSKNQRGMIASWQARRQLRKFVAQMPCGWEKYGIPPLAPFKISEAAINFQRGFLDSLNEILLFRVDYLNDMIIRNFKVSLFSKRVKFDFLFPKITISAKKYDTNTTFDALRELGFYAQYNGDGSFRLSLEGLSATGTMKGKVPILYGSAKLTSFKVDIKLKKCHSDVKGFEGNEIVQQYINQEIESHVEQLINNNTQKISDFIEETLKREINPRLKGKDFWSLLSFILTGNDEDGDPIVTNCVPPVETEETF